MPSSRANDRFVVGQVLHGVGQALHLSHGAQRAEQRAGDQGFAARAVGRTEVQILVRHGQGRLAEQLAAVAVTADIKMCKNAEMELTQPKVVASSADTWWRCRRHIAKGGSSERDIRCGCSTIRSVVNGAAKMSVR